MHSKLHLGCGYKYRLGYNNLDINAVTYISKELTIIQWEAPNELPFPDESIDFIYSSHFFEHLYHEEAIAVLRECQRVCRVGAILSIAVPDAGGLIKSYANDNTQELEKWRHEESQKVRTNPTFKPVMHRMNRTKEVQTLFEIDPRYLTIHEIAKSVSDITEVRLRTTKPVTQSELSPIDLITHLLRQSEHQQLYDLDKLNKQCEITGFQLIREREYIEGMDEEDMRHISMYADFCKV